VDITEAEVEEAIYIYQSKSHQDDEKKAAFTKIYEYYEQHLWIVLYFFLGNEQDAEDTYQETFGAVLKSKPLGYLPPVDFERWLFKVARNKAYDFLRKKMKSSSLSLLQDESSDPIKYALFASLSKTGHEDQITERLYVLQALSQLSERYRLCVILQDMLGASQREIAEVFGCSEKTVSSNVSRGRKKLCEIFA
jgi:RNA polymerase sigma-70 factor (ECF subfamily)